MSRVLRRLFTTFAVLVLGIAGSIVIASPASAVVETYPVTKSVDDGTVNTLRWAITQANAHANDPGTSDFITIDAGLAVTVNAVLPALTEGVTVVGGFDTSITRTANFDLLDIQPDVTRPEQAYEFDNITFQGFGTGRAINVASIVPIDSLTTNNCNFNDFSVVGAGGAVFVGPANTHGSVEFSVTNFSRNTASLDGGAAVILGATSFTVAGNGLGVGTADHNTGNSGGAFLLGQIRGPIMVRDMTFSDNTARIDGGAVAIAQSVPTVTVSVTNSVFDNNAANRHGGGIQIDQLGPGASEPVLLIDTSTFNSNDVVLGSGGAVWLETLTAGGTYTVRDSEFTANTTQGSDAGALYLENNNGSVEVESSTFANNNVFSQQDNDGQGNAVAIEMSNGAFRMLNSTVEEPLANNSAIFVSFNFETASVSILSSTVISGYHDLWVDENDGTTALINTIFVAPPSITNLIGTGLAFNSAFSLYSGPFIPIQFVAKATNQFDIADMKLGALAENGGPTMTRLPAQGSPAINAGGNGQAYLATTPDDQRGTDFPRILDGTIDVGAVEVPFVLPVTGTTTPLWMPLGGGLVLLLGAAAVAFSVLARRRVRA